MFEYDNGIEKVSGDPFKILRLLEKGCGCELKLVCQQVNSPDPMLANGASGKLIEAATVAFELTPWDGKAKIGLTEDKILELVRQFFKWGDEKKKKHGSTPTSRPAMASQATH